MNEVNDDDLDESMDAFEAASTASHIDLPTLELRHILLAPDGSNQDTAARKLTEMLGAQCGADVREMKMDEAGEAPFRQILAQCHDTGSELVIVPAPFREDFAELGASSIGTNLDMLLSHRETPLLVVRDPARDIGAVLGESVVPLSFLARNDIRAVGWAFEVLSDQGRIRLLAVADTSRLNRENPMISDSLELKDVDEATLSGLGHPDMAGLVAAVHRHAAERDIGSRLSVRVGSAVEAAAGFTNELECLVVVTCPRDPQAEGYSAVHSLIRQSRNPVLVV